MNSNNLAEPNRNAGTFLQTDELREAIQIVTGDEAPAGGRTVKFHRAAFGKWLGRYLAVSEIDIHDREKMEEAARKIDRIALDLIDRRDDIVPPHGSQKDVGCVTIDTTIDDGLLKGRDFKSTYNMILALSKTYKRLKGAITATRTIVLYAAILQTAKDAKTAAMRSPKDLLSTNGDSEPQTTADIDTALEIIREVEARYQNAIHIMENKYSASIQSLHAKVDALEAKLKGEGAGVNRPVPYIPVHSRESTFGPARFRERAK